MVERAEERQRTRTLIRGSLLLLGLVLLVVGGTLLLRWLRPGTPEERLQRWHPDPRPSPGVTPFPQGIDDRVKGVQVHLERLINEYAGDEKLPWGLAHGLIAMGKGFRTRDGVDAVEFLYAEVARPLLIGGRPSRYPGFPDDRLNEPHVDLMLKAVVEAGVDPDRPIHGAFGSGTVTDHMRGAMLRFDFDPAQGPLSIDHPDDLPWTLQALSTWMTPRRATWCNATGRTIDLHQVTDWAVTRLEEESARLRERREQGQVVRKDGTHLQAFTCGGAHLFQGVAHAVGMGFGSPQCREVMAAQTELLLWRREAELAAYQEALEVQPDLTLTILVQRCKFLGHWNESVHKALILGLYRPTPEEAPGLAAGLRQLLEAVEALEQTGAYQRMERLRLRPGRDLSMYLDLVGDSCHALRGLLLATGQTPY